MGQQQLMLIVLGVIIVGIAVTVGIRMMASGAVDANRDEIISQVAHLASKAQTHFRKPSAMGGGNNSFEGFKISTAEKGTVLTNAYRIEINSAPSAEASSIAEEVPIAGSDTLFIVGYGHEEGNDPDYPVMAVATVSQSAVTTVVTN